MLAKLWKKVLMFILIVACLFNVVIKLVNNISLEKELLSSAQYIQDKQDAEKAKEAEEANKKEESNGKKTNTTTTTTNNTKKQQNTVVIK